MKPLHALVLLWVLCLTMACQLNPKSLDSNNFACRGPDDCVDGYQCSSTGGIAIGDENGVCYQGTPPGETTTANDDANNDNADGNTDDTNTDDGNTDPTDTTPEEPDEELCGNGVVDPGEACDDGENNNVGDTPCINYCTEIHPWPIDGCHADVQTNQPEAEKNAVDFVAHNFELNDQEGAEVRLYDFCDRLVVINAVAAWSPPDRAQALELRETYESLRAQGLMVLTLMVENLDSQDPSKDDLAAWAEDLDLEHPVLADPEGVVLNSYAPNDSFGHFPVYIVIGRGGVVASIDESLPSDLQLEALLED